MLKDKMHMQHRESSKCLQVRNKKSKQSSFSLQQCRDAAWSFVNYSLAPGEEPEAESTSMAAKRDGGGKQTVLWRHNSDLHADMRPLSFVLVVQSTSMVSAGNQSSFDQFQMSRRLFHSVVVMKENPVVVAP
ncbi:hypothetical protein EON65_15100 [archaeon]|nr:MAG: hypothetical protein EON65_15100 [archaeon]